jgi:hypothetical protein
MISAWILGGCSSLKTSRSVSAEDNSQPVVDLEYKSHFIVNPPRTRIYGDGTVYWEEFGETNCFHVSKERVNEIVEQLRRAGFFELSAAKIASQIDRIDPNWSGRETRDPTTLTVDATTISLTAKHRLATNSVSWAMLDYYVNSYPTVIDIRVFKDCVEIVKSSSASVR